MRLYRLSPIENKSQLIKALEYIHFSCHKLCEMTLNEIYPVAGNIAIFSHYDEEYLILKSLQREICNLEDNFNQKYFKLKEPLTIAGDGNTPSAKYTHLYIRQPDPYRYQVGDLDFCIDQDEYDELKNLILKGDTKGARVFDRKELDMIELYNPDIDVLGYVSTHKMTEKVRFKQ